MQLIGSAFLHEYFTGQTEEIKNIEANNLSNEFDENSSCGDIFEALRLTKINQLNEKKRATKKLIQGIVFN